MSELKEIDFRFPVNIGEQKKIATAIETCDNQVNNQTKQLNCLKAQKKALMQQLLTGKRRVTVDEEAA